MPIKNDWTKNKKNLNFNNDEKKHNIILGGIIIVALGATIGLYLYIQNLKEKEIQEYNKQVTLYNKMLKEKKDIQNKNINNYENNSYKDFNIKIEYTRYEDYNFIYNIQTIINELNKIKSKENENDYKIEIVGNISEYGNLFYKIYKRNNSYFYDDDFNKTLENLKKVKFREQSKNVNFKIYIHNNSYDLN